MNAKHFLLFIVVAAVAAGGGWFAARNHSGHDHAAAAADSSGKIYSCSMHPQVRSNKPGKCPFCGMALAPLSEIKGGEDLAAGSVMLSSNRINVINVQTVEARPQPLRRALRVAGTIDDSDTRRALISAYVDGRIDKLFVNYVGAEVKQGEPLATLYSPMLLSAAREYIALVQHPPAANLPDLHKEHGRLVAGAAQRLKQMGLTEPQIAALPNQREGDIHIQVLAPASGTVTGRFAFEGQYVKEGEKLFEIADFSTMWFRFDAYERDLVWLRPGQQVAVTTPALPGKTFTAPITFIDPNLSDPTRSAKVRVELPNPVVGQDGRTRRELLNKLYAEGVVQVEVPNVLAVPRTAVLSPGQQPIVYVDKGGGVYEPRRVKLGRSGDDLWEVLDGLKEGEPVVTTGNMLIDAQAQLDSSGSSPETPGAPADFPAFTQDQQGAVRGFLTAAEAIGLALAADKSQEFNQEAAQLQAVLPALISTFTNAPEWRPLIEKIRSTGHLAPAGDLATARRAYLPFSSAVVEFTKAARQQEPFKTVKVFKCPMANQAFPGAPRTAFWMQTQAPIRNPFFGAEMLDCGTEVKP